MALRGRKEKESKDKRGRRKKDRKYSKLTEMWQHLQYFGEGRDGWMCQTEEMMQSGNKFKRNFYYEYGTCKMVKTGLQKDNHVCDMFLWTDENLVNL